MEIKGFLAPSQVVINRHPSDRIHLLDDLAHRAAVALELPHEVILSALLKREDLGSTGTGKGVALPHARLPGVSKPFAVLVRLNKAIDFDAIDDEPVDIACLLLLPTDSEEGGHALACAARVLRDPEVLRNLRQATDHKEAYRALVSPIDSLFEAARHRAERAKRRDQEIVCPNCKKTGSAMWEDIDNPVHGGEIDSTLLAVSCGFRIGEGTEIFCATCDFKVQT
jgi:nitrogen PTS system EIIA component